MQLVKPLIAPLSVSTGSSGEAELEHSFCQLGRVWIQRGTKGLGGGEGLGEWGAVGVGKPRDDLCIHNGTPRLQLLHAEVVGQ